MRPGILDGWPSQHDGPLGPIGVERDRFVVATLQDEVHIAL